MPWIRIMPALKLELDMWVAPALKTSDPKRRLAADHSFGPWQSKSHGSASIQQPVDLGNGLAHLLFDALDAKARALGNLRIAEAVDSMRKEDVAGLWLQFGDGLLEPPKRVARFKHCDLIELQGRNF